MITDSGQQPLLTLLFAAGGALAYLPMIIIGWLAIGKRFPALKHVLEGVWGLFFCLAFVAIAHLAYDGIIKYFTVLAYLAGAAASAVFLELPIEKLARAFRRKLLQKRQRQSERQ